MFRRSSRRINVGIITAIISGIYLFAVPYIVRCKIKNMNASESVPNLAI